MSKFCPNCGKEVKDNDVFCGSCGASLKQENANTTNSANVSQTSSATSTSNPMVQNRNIALCIVFSILTCGIYMIYWFIVLNDEANRANEEPNATSGVVAFLFNMITCGIYGIYWSYKMGQKLYQIGQKRGLAIADNSIIYLLLSIFGLGIVNYCLIQNDLNKLSQ